MKPELKKEPEALMKLKISTFKFIKSSQKTLIKLKNLDLKVKFHHPVIRIEAKLEENTY